jgi:hypothetical protein
MGKVNEDQEIQRYWLCKIYYNGTVVHPLTHYLIPCPEGTTKAIDHLQRWHRFDRQGSEQLPSTKKRKQHDLQEAWSRQEPVHHTAFDNTGRKAAYVEWAVCSGISLREASAAYHNRLLAF